MYDEYNFNLPHRRLIVWCIYATLFTRMRRYLTLRDVLQNIGICICIMWLQPKRLHCLVTDEAISNNYAALSGGATCQTSSQFDSTHGCEQALDDNLNPGQCNEWATDSEGIGAWINIQFVTRISVREVHVLQRCFNVEQCSELNLCFSQGQCQEMSLVCAHGSGHLDCRGQDWSIKVLNRSILSDFINITVTDVCSTLNNGFREVRVIGDGQPNNTVLYLSPVPPAVIVEGTTILTMTCSAESTSLPATDRPTMMYRWMRNGVNISTNDLPDRHSISGTGNQQLTVNTAHRSDQSYVCTAQETNSTFPPVASQQRDTDVLYGPSNPTLTRPDDQIVIEGDAVTVRCQSDCYPACTYRWEKASSTIHGADRDLTLTDIRPEQQGTYRCIAANTINGRQRYRHVDIPVFVHYPPKVSTEVSPSKVIEGDPIKVTCTSDARPADTTFTWYNTTLGEQQITEGITSTHTTSQLTIASMTCLHNQEFTCAADNGIMGSPVKHAASIEAFCM